VTHSFIAQLTERGYQARIVNIQRLHDLQEEIESRYKQGLFDEQFYQENLADEFDFNPPDDLQARSLIVAAIPLPDIQLVFGSITVLVPSLYLRRREAEKRLADALAETLSPHGWRAVQVELPQKLLAVRSGLGRYGKNNVCYVPGIGSYNRLATFYSDLPCLQDDWQEARMLERCQNCSACLRNCPTGAISAERFVIHAERCLTLHNEQPGDVSFPAWLDPHWHNSLIGCARCQNLCPQNKGLRRVEVGAEFSEEETALLLAGVPLDQLPAATAQKLEQLDLDKYVGLLPRNLGALLDVVGTPDGAWSEPLLNEFESL
jgi:epoxyqueuosine reductase